MKSKSSDRPKTIGEFLRDIGSIALMIGALIVGAEVLGDL
jgi:hypothetical protein